MRGIAELRLQLADRERRLAELTEQSLQILDRLVETRLSPDERRSLAARITDLESALADTRQRLRVASRAVLGTPAEQAGAIEVVAWGFGAEPAARLRELAADAGAPVTVLMGAGQDPARFAVSAERAPSVHATECSTPAHFWNEAMATTQAAVVVIVHADTSMTGAALARLGAAAAAEGIAIASPALLHPDGRSLGRTERSLLDLVPHPASTSSGVEAIPFASPEVFAVARDAYHQLGPFDQDIAGDLALAEWTLRVGSRQLRCVGVADVEARVPAIRDGAADSMATQSDRLVILARHRPQQVAAAALAADSLWQQEPMALAGVLRAAFRRLPHAADLPSAVDLLVVQAQTIAGWKRLAPALRERLAALAGVLRVPVGELVADPGLVALAERLHSAAEVLRERAATSEHADEVDALRQKSDELSGIVTNLRDRERALHEDAIARANTIDSLRQELIEREHAIASLRADLGHRQGERDRLIDHLGHVQQDHDRLQEEARLLVAERAVLRDEVARTTTDNAALRAEVARLTEAATRADALRVDLEKQLADERDRAREIERQLGRAIGRTLELDPQLSAARASLNQLEGMLADEAGRLQKVLTEIDDLRGGHESLRREHGSLQEQRVELEARAHELVQALRERDRWIASLLAEVQQWRLRRRPLTPHEAEFLARHGGDGRR